MTGPTGSESQTLAAFINCMLEMAKAHIDY